jgi:A/G-specific adenine glycosylase
MNGNLPETAEALEALPGIGRYTAGAVASFAFGKRVPVVDTNTHRVLNRLFPGTGGIAESWRLAKEILPQRNSYSWNQGLMELGALICTSSSPRCLDCPLKSVCPSAFSVRRGRRKSLRPEPGRDGLPNRIYRGRIIEALRNLNGRGSIPSRELGKRVKTRFTAKDLPWLHKLLSGLERDGLIRMRIRSGNRIISFAE